jgi:predicted permease
VKTEAWRRYLRFWRADVEDDVDEELRFHVEMREREYLAAGLAAEDAHAEALRRFGSFANVRDVCYRIGRKHEREVRFAEFVSGVTNDVVFAIRQLARNRGFAIAAVLTLALGIGANGFVLGLVNAVLLRPLPGVRDPGRLVAVTATSVSYPAVRDFRDTNPALSSLAASRTFSTAVSDGKHTEVASVGVVTGAYFRTLGVRASHGRLLTDSDDEPGAPKAAVLSATLARHFFPENTNVVGRTVDLNGTPVVIAGVASDDFHGMQIDHPEQLWISVQTWIAVSPRAHGTITARGQRWFQMVGRLNPHATRQAANAAFIISASRQEAAYPDEARGLAAAIRAAPLSSAADAALVTVRHSTAVRTALILTVVVAIVLLISCANVCNLLLARAMARRREIGVRIAIGARSGRIVRQLFTETAVLALLAAVVGLVVTQIGTHALEHLNFDERIPAAALGVHVGWRVTVYTSIFAMIATILAGTLPAFHSTRTNLSNALKDGTPGGGHARPTAQHLLLVTQVALSLILLIGAGLFTRSLQRAIEVDPGVDGTHVAVGLINVGLIPRDSARAGMIYSRVSTRLVNLPGVRFVAWATSLPLSTAGDGYGFRVEGSNPPPGTHQHVEVSEVSPQYFAAFAIPLARGRFFDERDRANGPRTAIINETMARRYWSGGDPLGKRIFLDGDTVTIVGVVHDLKYHELYDPPKPFVYRVLDQHLHSSGLFPVNIVVRTNGDPAAILGAIRRVIYRVAPEVPLYQLSTFEQRAAHTTFAQRLGTSVLGLFSALALIITAVGIYGVVGYRVTQRTREIGIRIALGARTRTVLRVVLTDNLATILLGIAIGLALSIVLTRTVRSFLFGVSDMDPVTFVTASLVLLIVGTVATLIPALRATRVDPVIALRSE